MTLNARLRDVTVLLTVMAIYVMIAFRGSITPMEGATNER